MLFISTLLGWSGMAVGVALVKAAIWFNASAPEYLNGGVMQQNFQSSWVSKIAVKLTQDQIRQGIANLSDFVLQNLACVNYDKYLVYMSL